MGRNLTNQISKRTIKLEKCKHTLELADQRAGTESARDQCQDVAGGRRLQRSLRLCQYFSHIISVTKYQPNHLKVGEGLFSSPWEGLRSSVAAGAGGGRGRSRCLQLGMREKNAGAWLTSSIFPFHLVKDPWSWVVGGCRSLAP